MPKSAKARLQVALLIESSNRYGRDLLYGVHDWVTGGARWSIRLLHQPRPAQPAAGLEGWAGDGIIARVNTPALAAALDRMGLPVVDVSAERPTSEFPRVSIDNVRVAEMAVEHFRGARSRAFAFCGDNRFLWSQERGKAFIRRLREAGHACHAYGLSRGRDPRSGSPADAERLRAWLRSLPRPANLFACYDSRAQQILAACQELGLSVPGDIAVLGVDSDEVICELCEPPLSSILPNARKTGFEAAEILSRLMAGQKPARRTISIPPLRIVERGSTSSVAVEDAALASAVRHIRERACDGINVHDLLGAVPMSRTLLERKFQRALGESPHRMILRTRTERACQMLIETDVPVARIADLCGFGSPSYMSSVFRREVREAPLAFRFRHRTGASLPSTSLKGPRSSISA